MAAELNYFLPQEGTNLHSVGESLPEHSCSGCPAYSGEGKIPLKNTTKRKRAHKSVPPSLSVDFCNVRGLHSNLNPVHHHLETEKPALLFLTETQIRSPSDTTYLCYPGYKLEHTFIPRAGVCVFVREDICYRRLVGLEGTDLSIIWLRADCGDHPRIYACLYRSHSGDAETDRLIEHIQTTADAVHEQIPSAEIIILGDFNAHHTQWLGSRTTDHAGRSVHNFAMAYGLTQLVSSITRLPDIADHTPSILDLLLTSHPANYQGMELFIPNSVVPVGGKSQPWYGRPCKMAARLKQECFHAWAEAMSNKDPNASALKKRYNSAARAYKRKISTAKSEFIGSIGEKLLRYPSGSRAFWSLAKAVQGNFCKPSLPPLRREDDTLAHSSKEKADLLGALFASNSTLDDRGNVPPTIMRCKSSMPNVHFRQNAVRKALFSLDTHKSSGPDGIPAIVLKRCAPELAPVLTELFRYSYNTGIVPASWKTASVHPIPKKGDQSDPTNYRPIAITSLLSKVMENIINSQLLGYLEENQLISDQQYGFRHGRSAGDLLIFLTHRWASAVESKGEALEG
ncbi:unnamed protein product [Colias eurytheme]|nr:unnamed protein product [Colias eurytheme]